MRSAGNSFPTMSANVGIRSAFAAISSVRVPAVMEPGQQKMLPHPARCPKLFATGQHDMEDLSREQFGAVPGSMRPTDTNQQAEPIATPFLRM